MLRPQRFSPVCNGFAIELKRLLAALLSSFAIRAPSLQREITFKPVAKVTHLHIMMRQFVP
jgi:hypothetical protein